MEEVKLGVLQLLWDAWEPEHNNILHAPNELFFGGLREQLEEIQEHLASGRLDKALNEIVDIISLSQNWLRKYGLEPDDIVKLIEKRVETRYLGKTEEIMKKYGWIPR